VNGERLGRLKCPDRRAAEIRVTEQRQLSEELSLALHGVGELLPVRRSHENGHSAFHHEVQAVGRIPLVEDDLAGREVAAPADSDDGLYLPREKLQHPR
jgi:hypothetical protein